jgi:hypothetical protein
MGTSHPIPYQTAKGFHRLFNDRHNAFVLGLGSRIAFRAIAWVAYVRFEGCYRRCT